MGSKKLDERAKAFVKAYVESEMYQNATGLLGRNPRWMSVSEECDRIVSGEQFLDDGSLEHCLSPDDKHQAQAALAFAREHHASCHQRDLVNRAIIRQSAFPSHPTWALSEAVQKQVQRIVDRLFPRALHACLEMKILAAVDPVEGVDMTEVMAYADYLDCAPDRWERWEDARALAAKRVAAYSQEEAKKEQAARQAHIEEALKVRGPKAVARSAAWAIQEAERLKRVAKDPDDKVSRMTAGYREMVLRDLDDFLAPTATSTGVYVLVCRRFSSETFSGQVLGRLFEFALSYHTSASRKARWDFALDFDHPDQPAAGPERRTRPMSAK